MTTFDFRLNKTPLIFALFAAAFWGVFGEAARVRGADVSSTPPLCRAAVYNDAGASPTCANASLEILNAAPNFEAQNISAEEIRRGKLREFDVVLFPGGTGSGESSALGEDGWRELRSFLTDGGGYLGTCAGAYMALFNDSRSTGSLIAAELQDGPWERGEAILEIELTEEGAAVCGDLRGRLNVAYQNGPVFHRAPIATPEPYVVLAYYRTEIAENGAEVGVQRDSPAIAVGRYGLGRVAICGPHPELTPNLRELVPRLARCAAGK